MSITATPPTPEPFHYDCYVLSRSEHTKPIKAKELRRTQTTIVVVTEHNGRQMTFKLRKYGDLHQEHGNASQYTSTLLSFDVAGTEAEQARKALNRDTSKRAHAALEAITKTQRDKSNGYGHIHDRDYMLRLEAAVAIIVNGAPAHLLPSYPHDNTTTHNVKPA